MAMADTEPDAAGRLSLPAELERQLAGFRTLVGLVKLARGVCVAAVGMAVCQLGVFGLDRLGETPGVVRFALWSAAVVALAALPWAAYRWVWVLRPRERVARLIGRRFASLGDQLLGIIEIVRENASGPISRSPSLCAAAIRQVAEQAARHDLRRAVPPTRLGGWAVAAAVAATAVVGLAIVAPAAAGNAWVRLAMPWSATPRFTFTRLEPVPGNLVVPHGESTSLAVRLRADSSWRPRVAAARAGEQRPLEAALDPTDGDGTYGFTLPPQLGPVPLAVRVGDARARVELEPLLRPEIVAVEAEVELPGYLERPGTARQDLRGGTLAPVVGSTVALIATANRPLEVAAADGVALDPAGERVRIPPRLVERESTVTLDWRDFHGLGGARPLEMRLAPREDAAPAVGTTGLPAGSAILLDTDTLAFSIAATDDFGIREIGIEWEPRAAPLDDADPGPASSSAAEPAGGGERVLGTGAADRESLEVAATFSPRRLGVVPQPLLLRAFATDFRPGRTRSRSPPVLLYVVDREEHAFIINEQLNRWRQQAGEVRDREMALLATNRELRGLSEDALSEPQTRDLIRAQAAAERANARRLERLVGEGEDLVREAVKNPEFEAAMLEALAADVLTLAEIAAARMPEVADLLQAAARARSATGSGGPARSPEPVREPSSARQAGSSVAVGMPERRADEPDAMPASSAAAPAPAPGLPPGLADRESSRQPAAPGPGGPPAAAPPRIGLPSTQAGVSPPGDGPARPAAGGESLAAAIAAQEALLAEFARIADELAAVMARLEGSTFVKRFKLASREQGALGAGLATLGTRDPRRAAGGGGPAPPPAAPIAAGRGLDELVAHSSREAEKISHLMDDLQAYFERRRLPAFRTVLEEMKELDALGSLRQLSDDIRTEAGLSIAQAEFWSDTFDRLADDLVPPPGQDEGESGAAERADMPPEVVLEVLRILEAEVSLREETRVAEQSRDALDPGAFSARATVLAEEQHALGDRVARLAAMLIGAAVDGPLFGKDIPLFGPLPIRDGRDAFKAEIALFDEVEEVMREAGGILARPDTGPEAIASETEAIELLLASRAAGGGGGGGGMALAPGGGGSGTARSPAIANLGRGNRFRRHAGGSEDEQATGVSGRELPEEFRAGLDDYFNRLERAAIRGGREQR